MKKIGFILIIIPIFVLVILGFNISSSIKPNTFYQVYLDGNVIGMIKSKEKLEHYINEQGNLIKNQVLDYQDKIEIIDDIDEILNSNYPDVVNDLNNYKNIYNSFIKCADDKGNILISKEEVLEVFRYFDIEVKIKNNKITNYKEIEEYLNNQIKKIYKDTVLNINKELLNETENYSLSEYLKNKYYEIPYSKIFYMKNYLEENEIYAYVDNIYKPLGINIEKINTYKSDVISEKEIYNKIVDLKPCTIEGYQIRIKKQGGRLINNNVLYASLGNTSYKIIKDNVLNDTIIYVTDKEIFDEAVKTFTEVFVGKDELDKYLNETQEEITETGTNIENIYINEDITIKQTNISVKEKIYTNAADLSSYLLYGNNVQITKAIAKATDTISSFAYQNGISVEEFFLFNREFTSINNIFYDGQEIVIARLNPQINLVVQEYSIVDKETNYDTVERYNSSLTLGSRLVVQNGSNGIERVSQNVTKVNGAISSIEPISKETIVGSTSEIVDIGTKVIPYVGSTSSWGWPTDSGYTLSSYFGYRMSVFGEGDFHSGLDIAGTGYGSNVYAANNGVIITKTYTYSYGNYIMIDHNNGFYTLYAHMAGFAPGTEVGQTVARGQVIGYVGQSGWATGPHLHFEIRVCERYACCADPLRYY